MPAPNKPFERVPARPGPLREFRQPASAGQAEQRQQPGARRRGARHRAGRRPRRRSRRRPGRGDRRRLRARRSAPASAGQFRERGTYPDRSSATTTPMRNACIRAATRCRVITSPRRPRRRRGAWPRLRRPGARRRRRLRDRRRRRLPASNASALSQSPPQGRSSSRAKQSGTARRAFAVGGCLLSGMTRPCSAPEMGRPEDRPWPQRTGNRPRRAVRHLPGRSVPAERRLRRGQAAGAGGLHGRGAARADLLRPAGL